MHNTVEAIAREAGELALEYFRRLATLAVESKGHLDLVTAADRDVERFITERLRLAFPGDGIFGEEGNAVCDTTGRIWVIDPIDGTFNFVRGGDQWAISIGLFQDGAPVFGVVRAPARDETLTAGSGVSPTFNGIPLASALSINRQSAVVGVGCHPSIPTDMRLETLRYVIDELGMSFRCCGSATLSLMQVARGQIDGYIGMGDSTWDVVGAFPALRFLGFGSTINWKETPLSAKLRYVCGKTEVVELVKPILDRWCGMRGS